MGYYTNYELTEKQKLNLDGTLHYLPFDEEEAIQNYLEGNPDTYYAILEDADSTKWYDHDTDMIELSKAFPNVVFTLHGEGEETGDIWDKYYCNGKSETAKAEVIIPPISREFLSEVREIAMKKEAERFKAEKGGEQVTVKFSKEEFIKLYGPELYEKVAKA